jgi:hypothetical protein
MVRGKLGQSKVFGDYISQCQRPPKSKESLWNSQIKASHQRHCLRIGTKSVSNYRLIAITDNKCTT